MFIFLEKKFLLSAVLFSLLFFPVLSNSYAHLEHGSSGGVMQGKYFTFIGLDPKSPSPGIPAKIIFSIQDENANDVYDIETMVEIYSSNMEKRLFYQPWTVQHIGDFDVPFVFEDPGAYQIVLSVSEDDNPKKHVVSPRQTPSSSSDCNCTRMLFNVSVSETWDVIWNSLMVIIVVLPFSVFGYAMWKNYRNINEKLSVYETLRYAIMFLAFAGGLIHLSIYVDHVPLRIEYGLFLLLAAISQIGFGVLSLSTLLFDTARQEPESTYRRNMAIYFFGLIGSAVLIGLYVYAISYPPPLSPENHPEHIDIAGISAKALEISLIGVIVYVINHERMRRKKQSS